MEGTAHDNRETPDWKKGDNGAQKIVTDTEKTQSEKRKSLFYTQRRIRESIFKITKKTPLFENEEIN